MATCRMKEHVGEKHEEMKIVLCLTVLSMHFSLRHFEAVLPEIGYDFNIVHKIADVNEAEVKASLAKQT